SPWRASPGRNSAAARRRAKPRRPTGPDAKALAAPSDKIPAGKPKGETMSGHGHVDHHGGNKGVALLISVLALVVAFSETLGKGAQTGALAYNIEASNLWAFFQAKTIRQTVLRTAAEELEVSSSSDAQKKQAAKWKETAQRYKSETETGEGREQITERAT